MAHTLQEGEEKAEPTEAEQAAAEEQVAAEQEVALSVYRVSMFDQHKRMTQGTGTLLLTPGEMLVSGWTSVTFECSYT